MADAIMFTVGFLFLIGCIAYFSFSAAAIACGAMGVILMAAAFLNSQKED